MFDITLFVGQGRQVPSDSHREQDPQAGPLLQDQESTGPQLEVVSIVSAVCGNALFSSLNC